MEQAPGAGSRFRTAEEMEMLYGERKNLHPVALMILEDTGGWCGGRGQSALSTL
jgi:hypothetical protein